MKRIPILLPAVFTCLLAGCASLPAEPHDLLPTLTADEVASVYGEYVDAANWRGDRERTPRPESYLAGGALDSELASLRDLEERGLRIDGESRVTSFELASSDEHRAVGAACLDVTDTVVIDATGNDVTPPSRRDRTLIEVSFVRSGDTVLIDDMIAIGDSC